MRKLSAFFLASLLLLAFSAPVFAEDPPAFLLKWGSQGSGDGQFVDTSCMRVAVNQSGNVYVTSMDPARNYIDNRVQKFSSNGIFVTKWYVPDAWVTDGVAVESSGNILVGRYQSCKIWRLNSDLGYLETINYYNSYPVTDDIALDSYGNILGIDQGDYRIGIINPSTGAFRYWSLKDEEAEIYIKPLGIAADSSGFVYITAQDMGTNKFFIRKYNSAGSIIKEWGATGSGDGQFNNPRGIAVDPSGKIYVADTDNNRIQKFDSNGTFLTKWGSAGSGDGQFNKPIDVALDSTGNNIYVTDSGNYRVQKFGYAQTNQPPVANAGPDQTGDRGVPMTFDGSGSSDPDNDELTYTWNFDDDTPPATGKIVSHTFTQSYAQYTVTLTVSDGKETASDTCNVTIIPNKPPVADAGPDDRTVNRLTPTEFNGSATDPNGDNIQSYKWRFYAGPNIQINPKDGQNISFIYPKDELMGSDRVLLVSLEVTDDKGAVGRDNCTATCINYPPTINSIDVLDAYPPYYTNTNLSFMANYTDDQGPFLGSFNKFTWDFGDGQTETVGINTSSPHQYSAAGDYNVKCVVTDADGATGEKTIPITVVEPNQPPVADAGPDIMDANRRAETVLDGSNSYDPDGATDIVEYKWEFGDGQSITGTDPVGRHVYTDLGEKTATLTVKDSKGVTSSDTCKVTVVNLAPIANAGADDTITALNTSFQATKAFSASGSIDPDGEIVEYNWNFGDGNTGTGATVTHQYTGLNTYTVTLTVKDNNDATATDTCVVSMNVKVVIPSGTTNTIKIAMPNADGTLPPGLDTDAKVVYMTKEDMALYHPTSQGKSPKTGKGFEVFQK